MSYWVIQWTCMWDGPDLCQEFRILFSTKWRFNFEYHLSYRVSISYNLFFILFFFFLIRTFLASFFTTNPSIIATVVGSGFYTDSIIEIPFKGFTFSFRNFFFLHLILHHALTKKKTIKFYNPCEMVGLLFRMENNESFLFISLSLLLLLFNVFFFPVVLKLIVLYHILSTALLLYSLLGY
jgi:hypothetical protein